MATQKRKSSHPCRMALLAAVVVLIAGPVAAQTPINDAQQQWQQLNAQVVEAYRGGRVREGCGLGGTGAATGAAGVRPAPSGHADQPQQPGLSLPGAGPLRRGGAALSARRCRDAARRSARAIRTRFSASTTWPFSTRRRAATARRSRSSRRRCRGAARCSARAIRTR